MKTTPGKQVTAPGTAGRRGAIHTQPDPGERTVSSPPSARLGGSIMEPGSVKTAYSPPSHRPTRNDRRATQEFWDRWGSEPKKYFKNKKKPPNQELDPPTLPPPPPNLQHLHILYYLLLLVRPSPTTPPVSSVGLTYMHADKADSRQDRSQIPSWVVIRTQTKPSLETLQRRQFAASACVCMYVCVGIACSRDLIIHARK